MTSPSLATAGFDTQRLVDGFLFLYMHTRWGLGGEGDKEGAETRYLCVWEFAL